MNSILASTCNGTDWSQFLPSMIATFVGFILALLGQLLFEKTKALHESNGLIKRITAELQDIKKDLEEWGVSLIERQPLKTLVWDEAINSGQLSLLNRNKRALLFKIYKQIQEFNSWSEEQTKFYFEHNGVLNTIISNELLEERNKMLGLSKRIDNTDKIDIPYVLITISNPSWR